MASGNIAFPNRSHLCKEGLLPKRCNLPGSHTQCFCFVGGNTNSDQCTLWIWCSL